MSAAPQGQRFAFPEDLQPVVRRARRLAWLTIAYMASTTVLVALVAEQSQALKTTWVDDALSLIPPIVFLIGNRVSLRRPDPDFPYGYHRAAGAAYLGAALALLVMGGFLFVDAMIALLAAEHPTVGAITVFGETVWLGWAMLGALLYSTLPTIWLGRAKLRLAHRLYDKVLFADGTMNSDDWLSGLAAIAGVFGLACGWWWADAVAGALISLDILHDGWRNLRAAVLDLIDHRPTVLGRDAPDPAIAAVRRALEAADWIADFDLRMRVTGNTLAAEALVLPRHTDDLAARVEATAEAIGKLDWRLQDVTITPVRALRRDAAAEADPSPAPPPRAVPPSSGHRRGRAP